MICQGGDSVPNIVFHAENAPILLFYKEYYWRIIYCSRTWKSKCEELHIYFTNS
jgi:hypothetical protein